MLASEQTISWPASRTRAAVLLLNKAKIPRLCRKQHWNAPIPKAIHCLPKIFIEEFALKEILPTQTTYSWESIKPHIFLVSAYFSEVIFVYRKDKALLSEPIRIQSRCQLKTLWLRIGILILRYCIQRVILSWSSIFSFLSSVPDDYDASRDRKRGGPSDSSSKIRK